MARQEETCWRCGAAWNDDAAASGVTRDAAAPSATRASAGRAAHPNHELPTATAAVVNG